ncbi:MAG: SRPBCC domain-containing protein [Acidimicrobiia bacterium]
MTTTTTRTTQVFRVYIKATPEAVWEAITSKEWTAKYGYPGHNEYDLRPGGAFRALMPAEMAGQGVPEVGVDGEVTEVDPPHRLVQTWRFHFMPDQEAEGFHEVTWDIHAEHGGITRLTVTHDVTDAPITAAMIEGSANLGEGGGGWAWILSDLKTLLETGGALEG